jgi:hypothetical protein
MQIIPDLYSKLLAEEKSRSMEASIKLLNTILEEKGVSYDTFVLTLQQ